MRMISLSFLPVNQPKIEDHREKANFMSVPTEATPRPLTTASLTGLLNDFRLLVILFLALRVMLAIAYEPLLLETGERGIGTGGDRLYHYQLSALTEQGDWPFREWWSEFPPVWYLLTSLVYQLQPSYTAWSMVLGMIVLLCDVGNLALMRAIGTRLYGANTGMALAWIYALMSVPLIFSWWNFDVMVTFFLLLGLWWLLRGQETRSAVVAAIGALTKFVPALLLGAVFRFRPVQNAARYTAITVGVFAAVYILLLIGNPNPQMALVSLTAQFGKASYESVWALIDGNYTTGNFAAPGVDQVMVHYDVEAASTLYGNPPVIPGWLRLGAAALIGAYVYATTRRYDDRGLVAFVGITLLIFFLQAQGWSPQWLTQIIPLILLVFPTRNGVLTCVLLSGLAFTEYPLLFIRTGDLEVPGVISGSLLAPYVGVILLRTVILVAVCAAFYLQLRKPIVASLG